MNEYGKHHLRAWHGMRALALLLRVFAAVLLVAALPQMAEAGAGAGFGIGGSGFIQQNHSGSTPKRPAISGAHSTSTPAPAPVRTIPFEQTKQFDALYKTFSQEFALYGTTGQRPTRKNIVSVLKQEISTRQRLAASGCASTSRTLSDLLNTEELIVEGMVELAPFNDRQTYKINLFLQPFAKLAQQYMALRQEAAAAGALMPDNVWRAYKKAGGRSLFPLALAYGGEPGHEAEVRTLMARIKKFRKRDYDIYEIWVSAKKKFNSQSGQIKQVVETANSKMQQRLNALKHLYERFNLSKPEIERLFKDGFHQHCLGEIARKNGKAGKLKTTKLRDIPGMRFKLAPARARIAASYKPYKAPPPIGELSPLHFYKDPTGTARLYADRAEAAREGAEATLYVAQLEGMAHIQDIIKAYNPLHLLDPVAEHYNNKDESLWEAGANATNEIAYNMTVGFVIGTKNAAVDLAEKEYKRAQDGDVGFKGDVKDWKTLLTSYGDFTDAISKFGFSPDFGKHPDRPGPDASADDWANYANHTNNYTERANGATREVEANNKKVIELADRYNDQTQLLMAALMAKGIGHGVGKFVHGELPFGVPGAEVIERLKHLGEQVKEAAKDKVTSPLIEKLRTMQETARNARKVLENPEKFPQDVVDAAKNNSTLEQVNNRLNEQTKTILDAENDAVQTLIDEEQQSSRRTEDLSNPKELTDTNGNIITRGSQNLGEGSFKITYEAGNPNEVVQVYKPGEEASFTAKRENLGSDRATHAGVTVAKGKAVQLKDGSWVKVAERVNKDNIIENIVKDGRMTPEIKAAMLKTLSKLNDDGIVWTDPNPGNWYTKINENGTVEAGILDPDGMVHVRDLINAGKQEITINQKTFDLTNHAGVRELQEHLAIGDKDTFSYGPASPLRQGIGNEYGRSLSTPDYSMSSGEFVPTSYGSLRDIFADNFDKAQESFTQPDANITGILAEGRKNRLTASLSDNEPYNQATQEIQRLNEETNTLNEAGDAIASEEAANEEAANRREHHATGKSPEGQENPPPSAEADILDIKGFLEEPSDAGNSGSPSMDMPDMPAEDFSQGEMDALFGDM